MRWQQWLRQRSQAEPCRRRCQAPALPEWPLPRSMRPAQGSQRRLAFDGDLGCCVLLGFGGISRGRFVGIRLCRLRPRRSLGFAGFRFGAPRLLRLGVRIGVGLFGRQRCRARRVIARAACRTADIVARARIRGGGSVILPARGRRVVGWRGAESAVRRCCRRRRALLSTSEAKLSFAGASDFCGALGALEGQGRCNFGCDANHGRPLAMDWPFHQQGPGHARPVKKIEAISITYSWVREAGRRRRKWPPFLPGGKICRTRCRP